MTALGRAVTLFEGRFGGSPDGVARAPGRVNLIGDHTDYAEGFVLPLAIDRDVAVAFRARGDGRVVAVSEADEDQVELPPGPVGPPLDGWGRYLQGVVWALREEGREVAGCDLAVASDVPVEAGLSSSAAFELAVARALAAATDLPWDPRAMARLCQRVENGWVGLASGIMDPLVCALGQEGAALLLDCRTLVAAPVPLSPHLGVVVCHTGTNRTLLTSAYNARRADVEEAARQLGVPTLRDAAAVDLGRLDGVVLRRARHVVSENARVHDAAEALRRGDAAAAGVAMEASHASLRDDFEASTEALDAMVEIASGHPACHGAGMTGAGWGGCAVALVDRPVEADFTTTVSTAYRTRTGHRPRLWPCRPASGATLTSLS